MSLDLPASNEVHSSVSWAMKAVLDVVVRPCPWPERLCRPQQKLLPALIPAAHSASSIPVRHSIAA
eukprot:171234-Pelagomonas_calceolata.AAC.3